MEKLPPLSGCRPRDTEIFKGLIHSLWALMGIFSLISVVMGHVRSNLPEGTAVTTQSNCSLSIWYFKFFFVQQQKISEYLFSTVYIKLRFKLIALFLVHFLSIGIEQNNCSGHYLSNFVSYNTMPKNIEIFQKITSPGWPQSHGCVSIAHGWDKNQCALFLQIMSLDAFSKPLLGLL